MLFRRGRLTATVTRRISLHGADSTARKLSSWVRFLPIIFFLTYLNFTVLLFAFGPWPWPVRNGTKLYIFLGSAHFALLLGYLRGIRKPPRDYSGIWSIGSIIRTSLVVNLLMLGPTALARTGSGIPDIVGGLIDPGSAYSEASIWRSDSTETLLIEYARIILGPLLFLSIPSDSFLLAKTREIG